MKYPVLDYLKNYTYTLLFSIFFFQNLSVAQDSIRTIQKIEQINWDDKNAFNIFNQQMIDDKALLSLPTAIKYTKEALAHGQKANQDSLALEYSVEIMYDYDVLSNYQESFKYGELRLAYAQKLKDSIEIGSGLLDLGLSCSNQEKYIEAVDFYLQALSIAEDLKHTELKSVINTNLAAAYFQTGLIEEAIQLLEQDFDYLLNTNLSSKNYYLVSDCNMLSAFYEEQGNQDSVRYYIQQYEKYLSLLKAEQHYGITYHDEISQGYFRLSIYYLSKKDIQKARIYYKEYKEIPFRKKNYDYLLATYFSIQIEDFVKAAQLIKKPPIDFGPKEKALYYEYAALYYKKIGDYQEGLTYTQKSHDNEVHRLKSNTVNLKNYTTVRIEKLEKEQEVIQLKNEQRIRKSRSQIILVSFAFSIFLLGLLAYLYSQIRKRNNLLQQDLANKALIEKQAKELKIIEEQRTKLFVNIAHEFQTPLSIIDGLAKKVYPAINPKEKDYLTIISKNSTLLSDRIKEILALSRLDDVTPKVENSYFYINELIQQIIKELSFKAGLKNIQLQVEPTNKEFLIHADINKLRTILKNLITNAINYSQLDGLISVNLIAKDNSFYEVQIKDNGQGIPEEELPFIFDRYFQSNNKQAEGGFGIGLSICKEYTDLLGGTIEVQSQAGVGSVFHILLPKNISTGQIEQKDITRLIVPTVDVNENKLPKIESITQKKNVLVVEDNPDFCIYLDSFLAVHFNLTYVHNVEKAIQSLSKEVPDLILTDWMMPEKDGIALITYLKNNKKFEQIPVIMLTARSLISDQLKAMKLGADAYLIKPIDEEQLVAKVVTLLKQGTRKNLSSSLFELHQNDKDKVIKLDKKDQEWLLKLEQTILANLTDFELNLSTIALYMEVSLSQLKRKIKEITGLSAMRFIKEIRFWEARRMLEEQQVESVKIVSLSVGFKDVRNFSRNFKERFDKYPSEYL